MTYDAPGPSAARPPDDPIASWFELLATAALLLWIGGMVALGAFAAPTVFARVDGRAAALLMTTIFRRFDRLVLALVIVFAVAELLRNLRRRPRGRAAWLRMGTAALLVACGLLTTQWLSPHIEALFRAGATRGVGQAGQALDVAHRWVERIGKLAALSAPVWLVLGHFERRRRS